MLSKAKKEKLTAAVKSYMRTYFKSGLTDLDESGTRIMINTFLSEVLGYMPLQEIKTEYMIRGTYSDYMVQIDGTRHFLVEVKALSIGLSDKHLRQTINYGANEGIDWALLTNGRQFDLYKIQFTKPIESTRVFSIDLSTPEDLKDDVELLQYLHKDAVKVGGLAALWNREAALSPANLAGMLFSPKIVAVVKKSLKEKHGIKFQEDDLATAIKKLICSPVNFDEVKIHKGKPRQKRAKVVAPDAVVEVPVENPPAN